ncbi:MAG TPA: hypothetical protein VMI55_01865 [Thermoplasmata archaeon]|nr:hypothetical protein [Thermoplasmata archaeon]
MSAPQLLVSRCPSCTLRYLPRAGPCPKCGSMDAQPLSIPPKGAILAATELASSTAGGPSPHRIALVELAQAVRLLALVDGPLPALGSVVTVHRDGETYRVSTAPS